jgi:predicted nucleic acid-binding protein
MPREIVSDTSVLIAVVTRAPERNRLVRITAGAGLHAPPSVHWEMGNAFSAMIRRGRITVEVARKALGAYRKIPIRFVEIDLESAVELAGELGIYAYDAYLLECARQLKAPLLTLDGGLARAALESSVELLEV